MNSQASGEQWPSCQSPWWSGLVCLHLDTSELHSRGKQWAEKNFRNRLNRKLCDSASGRFQIRNLRGTRRLSVEFSWKLRWRQMEGQCQVVWCSVITWHCSRHCSGVTIASLSVFQQHPGGSLIQLHEALIAPTVSFPCLFHQTCHTLSSDLTPQGQGRRGECYGWALEKNKGRRGGPVTCGVPWLGQKFRAENLSPAWFGTQFSSGAARPPSLLALALFCHPLPPSNWI